MIFKANLPYGQSNYMVNPGKKNGLRVKQSLWSSHGLRLRSRVKLLRTCWDCGRCGRGPSRSTTKEEAVGVGRRVEAVDL